MRTSAALLATGLLCALVGASSISRAEGVQTRGETEYTGVVDHGGRVWMSENVHRSGTTVPKLWTWDGTQWAQEVLPAPPGDLAGYAIQDVAQSKSGPAIAVGSLTEDSGKEKPLAFVRIAHKWQFTETPSVQQAIRVTLQAGSSDRDGSAWTAGWASTPTGLRSFVLRWDGSVWRRVTFHCQPDCLLRDIDGVSSHSEWVIGSFDHGSGLEPLIDRWTGQGWKRFRLPQTHSVSAGAQLNGIDVVSTDDIWIVGNSNGLPLLAHWNGSTWRFSQAPFIAGKTILTSVAAVSGDDAWAVGYRLVGSLPSAVVLHWNGKVWSKEHLPGSSGTYLYGVSASSASNAWVVGSRDGQRFRRFWDGNDWLRS